MKTQEQFFEGVRGLVGAGDHTPTPWHVGMKPGPMLYAEDGAQVADLRSPSSLSEESRANAQHIVRCVNSHDALVEALESARLLLEECLEMRPMEMHDLIMSAGEEVEAFAREALDLATGKDGTK